MATSTLLQKLDVQADGFGPTTSNRRQVETFISGGVIGAGDWVQFNTGASDANRVLSVIEAVATFTLGNPLVVGVALDAATASGQTIRVVVSGYAEGANVDNAVAAAGTALVVDNTGAGIANALAAADTSGACGVSLEAAAGGKCDVWVYKNF
jgi:hypothetical protein